MFVLEFAGWNDNGTVVDGYYVKDYIDPYARFGTSEEAQKAIDAIEPDCDGVYPLFRIAQEED